MIEYSVRILNEMDGQVVWETEVDAPTPEQAEDLARQEFAGRFVVDVMEVDEPLGAGEDPAGRPDPRTHPEFWTE